MSKRGPQDHYVHILSLGGLLAVFAFTSSQTLVQEPIIVILAALIYVLVNVGVDLKVHVLTASRVLEYGTIGLLGAVVSLSFA